MNKLLFTLPLTALSLVAVAAPSTDLSKLGETIAQYKTDSSDKTKKPIERARAQYECLKLELLTCEDAAYPAKKAEMLAFLAKPLDLTPYETVEFLYSTLGNDRQEIFARPDIDQLADAASKGDASGRAAFWMRRLSGRWAEKKAFDPNRTWERRLELIAEAEKDELAKLSEIRLANWRLECYKGLGRGDDYDALVAKTVEKLDKPSERATLLLDQADFLRERADRYFAEPHAPTLQKAIAIYDQVVTLCADDKRLVGRRQHLNALKSAAECLLAVRDFAGCRARLATLVEVTPEKQRPNLDAAQILGDCAYAERKWEEAVTAYRSAEEKLNLNRKLNLGHALFALGRREEALPILEFAAKKGNKYTRLRYQYDLEKLKKELQ